MKPENPEFYVVPLPHVFVPTQLDISTIEQAMETQTIFALGDADTACHALLRLAGSLSRKSMVVETVCVPGYNGMAAQITDRDQEPK